MEELDLKELFSLFWNKKAAIVFITLIAMIIGVVYSYFYIIPEYTAKTSLVLVQTSSNSQTDETGITSTDLTVNSKLVSTYSDLIKRDLILGQVATNLNIEQSKINKIRNKVSVKSVSDTQIIEISVTDEDPNYACKIANEITAVFSEKIVDIYNISNVYLVDRAKVPTSPSNINHKKDIAIFAVLGLVISAVYVLVCNMLDTTVKTEKDIEEITKLAVLISIPNCELEIKETKGGKKK